VIPIGRVLGTSLALLTLLAPPALATDRLPDTVIPSGFGVCMFQPSWNDEQIGRMASAGFNIVRTGVWRPMIERENGEFNFSKPDSLMAVLRKHGITPILALSGSSKQYDEGAAPHTDVGRKEFARYAGAVAARYRGKGVIWKIWNEPNLGKLWTPAPSAEDYAKLAIAASKAIRAADPESIIIAPNMCGKAFPYLETTYKLGLLDCIDAVSVHPYGCRTPEEAIAYYEAVRELTRKYLAPGKSMPLVCEEWGFPSINKITVEQQARMAVRMQLVNLMCGVRLTAWYCWRDKGDSPADKEQHFGLLRPDLKPKPGYYAMQTLTRELRGCRYVDRMQPDGDDYLLLFKNGDTYRMAAWTSGKPHRVVVPLDAASARIVQIDGSQRTLNAADGAVTLDITDAVQYVEPIGPCKRLGTEQPREPSTQAR
jgi:polysaccharide biosynthesis protein PslG